MLIASLNLVGCCTGSSLGLTPLRIRSTYDADRRWVERHGQTGSVSPRRGRKPRSPLEPHTSWLLELIAQEADLTLAEIAQRLLAHRGARSIDSSIGRFFKRHKVSFKGMR